MNNNFGYQNDKNNIRTYAINVYRDYLNQEKPKNSFIFEIIGRHNLVIFIFEELFKLRNYIHYLRISFEMVQTQNEVNITFRRFGIVFFTFSFTTPQNEESRYERNVNKQYIMPAIITRLLLDDPDTLTQIGIETYEAIKNILKEDAIVDDPSDRNLTESLIIIDLCL